MRELQAKLDDPDTTVRRRFSLRKAGYLREIYLSWYGSIVKQLPPGPEPVLELGSGGGFFDELLPGLLTSDIQPVPAVRLRLDACRLPFARHSLRAVVGTNVLHHLPAVSDFFSGAEQVLVPGGRLVFIEPWATPFSTPIYTRLHHELFDRKRGWNLPPGGPLTAANGALAWILFHRDRAIFQEKFPRFVVRRIRPFMPLSYLVSGGIGRNWPLPGKAFRWVRRFERPFDRLGLFAEIVLEINDKPLKPANAP